jgi:hypothetical protein
MWFKGKLEVAIGGHHVKCSRLGSERQDCMFSLLWKIQKINIHTQKKTTYPNSDVEHVCNSGTTVWNSGKEEKEKRMIEHQQYHKS